MKLLFLAPQPFFQERGTPIAVRLALQVLAERSGRSDRIDLVVYHEGSDVPLPGVNVWRIRAPRALRGVGPGISVKKILCDVFFAWTTLRLVWRHRKDQYDLVHAVEESVFLALVLRAIFGIPYIYDMDSSLSLQVVEKWRFLKLFRGAFSLIERLAVKSSVAVVPVCDALAAIADAHGAPVTHVLRDVSLLQACSDHTGPALREEIGAPAHAKLVLYVGNLERYQGVDLLVESFARISKDHADAFLVVIGGTTHQVARYRESAAGDPRLRHAVFLGHRPVELLSSYIQQCDILAAPRILGNNTPMKIYSYLHSGKPIIATDIESHTQVLDRTMAHLVAPHPDDFAQGLAHLIRDEPYGAGLGAVARSYAENHYTFESFRKNLNDLYDRVFARVPAGEAVAALE